MSKKKDILKELSTVVYGRNLRDEVREHIIFRKKIETYGTEQIFEIIPQKKNSVKKKKKDLTRRAQSNNKSATKPSNLENSIRSKQQTNSNQKINLIQKAASNLKTASPKRLENHNQKLQSWKNKQLQKRPSDKLKQKTSLTREQGPKAILGLGITIIPATGETGPRRIWKSSRQTQNSNPEKLGKEKNVPSDSKINLPPRPSQNQGASSVQRPKAILGLGITIIPATDGSGPRKIWKSSRQTQNPNQKESEQQSASPSSKTNLPLQKLQIQKDKTK
jgi:hypothetical protein